MRHANSIRRRRRGATIVLLTLLMLALICMVVFAVEVGRTTVTKAQLQLAADAGAIAAALEVAADPAAAGPAARQFVQLNKAGWNETVPSSGITVQVGRWDPVGRSFAGAADDPMAVRVSAALDNEPFLFARLFRDSFQVAVDAVAVAEIQPQDIMMVLDLSGSMDEHDRISALRKAAPEFVNTLERRADQQQVGVMGYGVRPSSFSSPAHGYGTPYTSAPDSLYPADGSDWVGVLEAWLTSDFDYLRATPLAAENLFAAKYGGGTPIGAAVRDGVHCVLYGMNARPGAGKVVVLMSDGRANKPEVNAVQYALSMAGYAQSNHVVIHTISLGTDADTVLMADIADATGGTHYAVASGTASELSEAFRQAALAISTAVLVE